MVKCWGHLISTGVNPEKLSTLWTHLAVPELIAFANPMSGDICNVKYVSKIAGQKPSGLLVVFECALCGGDQPGFEHDQKQEKDVEVGDSTSFDVPPLPLIRPRRQLRKNSFEPYQASVRMHVLRGLCILYTEVNCQRVIAAWRDFNIMNGLVARLPWFLLFIVLLVSPPPALGVGSAAQVTTMRLDYFHTGNTSQELFQCRSGCD